MCTSGPPAIRYRSAIGITALRRGVRRWALGAGNDCRECSSWRARGNRSVQVDARR